MTETKVGRLRRARIDQDRGLRELARETETDPGQLSRIERGLERPSPTILLRLARALGLRDVERVLTEFYEENENGSRVKQTRTPRRD